MAEEENKEAEGEEGGSGNKKMIIIMAVVVLLAIGVSVGATIFLLGGDSGDEEEVPEVVEEPEGPTVYFDVNPAFLVTFDVNGRQRYMQISLTLTTKFASNLAALEHHMPLIRSRLISAYSAQVFSEVQTEAGKLALIEQTKTVINEVLESEGEKPIDKVYFTNFVMQ